MVAMFAGESRNRDKYSPARRGKKQKSIDNTLFECISMYPFYKNPARHAISSARFSVICIDHAGLNINDTFENTVREAQMVATRVIQEKYYVHRHVLPFFLAERSPVFFFFFIKRENGKRRKTSTKEK